MNQTAANDNTPEFIGGVAEARIGLGYIGEEFNQYRTGRKVIKDKDGIWYSIPRKDGESRNKNISLKPATLKRRKGVTIRMAGDPVSRPPTLVIMPSNDSSIIEVRNWPTATRYIRSKDGNRAKGLAKYAAANDNLAAPPIAANDNWHENEKHISRLSDDLNTDCLDEYRPSPEELVAAMHGTVEGSDPLVQNYTFEQLTPREQKAGNIPRIIQADGLKFGPRTDFGGKWGLIKWEGSDGVFRKPWEAFRQPKGGKDQVEELTAEELERAAKKNALEASYNKRMADRLRESNIWLEELMSTPSKNEMPAASVFPAVKRMDGDIYHRIEAAGPTVIRRALHTTVLKDKKTGEKKKEAWSYKHYEAALAAFTGTIKMCSGPVMPRKKNGDRQNNLAGLLGVRKTKQSKSRGGGTKTWEDDLVDRLDHSRLKARMDDGTVLLLELATTDAMAEDIGEALGYHGKYAQRRGVAAVDEAIDDYLAIAA